MNSVYEIKPVKKVTWDSKTEDWETKTMYDLVEHYEGDGKGWHIITAILLGLLGIWSGIEYLHRAFEYMESMVVGSEPNAFLAIICIVSILAGGCLLVKASDCNTTDTIKTFKTEEGAERYLEGIHK